MNKPLLSVWTWMTATSGTRAGARIFAALALLASAPNGAYAAESGHLGAAPILPIFVIKKVENHSRISKKRPKHMKFNRLNAKKYSFTFFLNNKNFIFTEVFALLPHQE